jgi:hypothetical protein
MNINRLALAMINTMLDADDDLIYHDFRALLIDIDADHDDPSPYLSILRDCISALDPHTLSLLRLDASLCPLHHCDYAICFDDDDTECATIRDLFPNHDT